MCIIHKKISQDGSPEDQLLASADREYLMDQILKLPYTESQVIILKYYRSLQYKEIARLSDISSSSVKHCLKQARKKLAKLLEENGTERFRKSAQIRLKKSGFLSIMKSWQKDRLEKNLPYQKGSGYR